MYVMREEMKKTNELFDYEANTSSSQKFCGKNNDIWSFQQGK